MQLIKIINYKILSLNFALLFLLTLGSLVHSNAQDFTISLPKVTQDNNVKDTEQVNKDTLFNGKLNPNDNLRFAWSNIDLNLESKTNPSVKSGYIKVYYNEIKDENFILDFAKSPLKLDNLAQKLKDGKNKVVFVLFNNNIATDKVINFSFEYTTVISDPSIKIVKPVAKSVFNKQSKNDFELNIENLLVKAGTNLSNYGKINIYLNEVSEKGYLTQIMDSDVSNTSSKVKFNQEVLGEKLTNSIDSEKNKLIFVPIANSGKIYSTNAAELEIITNFQNTLNIKTPSIEFLNVNNQNNTLTSLDLIRFKVSNFKILKFDTRNTNSSTEGYLQVLVNDKPHKINFEGSEFSVEQLIPGYKDEKINIKLRLVNFDFTDINPSVSNSIDLFIKKDPTTAAITQIEASNWRIVIIGITILLIVGSVLYIIFKT